MDGVEVNGVFEYRSSIEHSGGGGFRTAGHCDGVADCCLCLCFYHCTASNVIVVISIITAIIIIIVSLKYSRRNNKVIISNDDNCHR